MRFIMHTKVHTKDTTLVQGTLPYMIALDWERRAVIVGVRGTYVLLKDLSCYISAFAFSAVLTT